MVTKEEAKALERGIKLAIAEEMGVDIREIRIDAAVWKWWMDGWPETSFDLLLVPDGDSEIQSHIPLADAIYWALNEAAPGQDVMPHVFAWYARGEAKGGLMNSYKVTLRGKKVVSIDADL